MEEFNTICTKCGKGLDTAGLAPGRDFKPHCNIFHVVGNAERAQKQLQAQKPERKVRHGYGHMATQDIKAGLDDKTILTKYPIKQTYLNMLRYKIRKGIIQ